MKKIVQYRYEAYLFIIEAVYMIIELCAARVLSPYFGDSNIVWTSIIGIILLSSSIGNSVGGRMADKPGIERKLGALTVLTSVLVLAVPVLADLILSCVVALAPGAKLGAITGTVLLFMPSAMVFGTVPPVITKLKMNDLCTAGKTSGRLQAVSTLGSIFGTFLGGFLLVPYFGCRTILVVMAMVIALTGTLLGRGEKDLLRILLVVFTSCALVYVFSTMQYDNEKAVREGEMGAFVEYDTQYSRVVILNGQDGKDAVRYMIVGDGCESATFLAEDKKYELAIDYTKNYDLMHQANISVRDVLMIGGGGYAYPKYCVSHYPDIFMDVVEIDPMVTDLAKEYFFLDDALEQFNTKDCIRLNLINGDGKVYVNTTIKQYDAICNDAFTGTTPVKSLATIETVRQIHAMLRPGGVYLSNVIGSAEGPGSGFLVAEVYTVGQVFPYVYAVPCLEEGTTWSATEVINYMVVASDTPLSIPGAVELDLTDAVLLTDDYCPVDALVPTVR